MTCLFGYKNSIPILFLSLFCLVGMNSCGLLGSSDDYGYKVTVTNLDSVEYSVSLNDMIIGYVTTEESTKTFPRINDGSILMIGSVEDGGSIVFSGDENLDYYVVHSDIDVTIQNYTANVIVVESNDSDVTEDQNNAD